MKPAFIIRSLQPEADLPALVRLRSAIALADQTGEAIGETVVRERLKKKMCIGWPIAIP